MKTLLFFTWALLLSVSCTQAQRAAFCPAPNGMFPNPNSRTCRSFIRCTNGIGTFQRCRRGTIFNGQQCIPGNQNTCNRVNANNLNNPALFGGFGAANPNIIGQPGVWGAGAQPLPGAWNNGQLQNRQGFGGQGNLANPWNNGQLQNRQGFGGQGNLANPWNNGQLQNRQGFGGQGNLANPLNNGQFQNRQGFDGQGNLNNPGANGAASQWNNGAVGGAGQFRGFNPGFLATWFDGNLNQGKTDNQQVPNINNIRPAANIGNNRTTQIKGRNWP